ncbi:TrkA C-terminal domain-containing protein [Reinekea marina]|uniref:Cation:proton antiporter regulatory subunit n=1 Tax=Reinekea marina TaxID=1310421 RepID=A0ABV7WX91_9GAMM|nr:TrkA C-terminal domain-containing protein [Reinekea marina]MDN3647449.1 TrkA C-terminal domain-containing protein [Reinekea marina]
MSKGYGIAEIYIPPEANFVGQTITESGLPELDVNVLTLYRGEKVIPNPKYSRVLEPGDKLLCFGKMASMKTLVPKSARDNRKPDLKKLDTDITAEEPSQPIGDV